MPRERMTANDRAILADLRKRYSSSTIAREAERVVNRRPAKRGRPSDQVGLFLRAIEIFWAVELKRKLRPRYLTQASKRVAAEAQAQGENLSWETVRKIHREVSRMEMAFPLEEALAGVRKRRGGDTSYHGYKKICRKPPPGHIPPPIPKPK